MTQRQRGVRSRTSDMEEEEEEVDSDMKLMVDEMFRAISIDCIRERLQLVREEILEKVSNQMDDMVSEVVQRIEALDPEKVKGLFDESQKYSDRRKPSKEGSLPNKQFLPRNSLLTDLFKIKHIRTIYNIFVVILIILFINTAVYDIVETGSTNVGFTTVKLGFGKLTKVIYIWFVMMASTCALYIMFSFWAHRRATILPKSLARKAWDYGWLAALILYNVAFIVIPVKMLLSENLPQASSIIVLMEQLRMLMKTHAFVRSAAPQTLSYKPHTESFGEICPGFSKFLYFMFAPTLVYRNSYPRTKVIRWRVVLWNYTEVVLVVFYVAFIFERFLSPVFKQFGSHPMEPKALVLSIFGTMMPGILCFLCGFYCLLHSWMNGSAELLRFADRLFYKDWWNSTSYDAYYRTWNVVVHDWLYTYIYKDMYENVCPRNKILATSMVFLVSAVFHEYILAFAFRFFYPVMMLMFGGVGLTLVFITRKHVNAGGNIFMWLTLCIGSGVLLSLYSMEFYARKNCPPYEDEFLDLFLPRSWVCHRFSTA